MNAPGARSTIQSDGLWVLCVLHVQRFFVLQQEVMFLAEQQEIRWKVQMFHLMMRAWRKYKEVFCWLPRPLKCALDSQPFFLLLYKINTYVQSIYGLLSLINLFVDELQL